MILPPPGQDYPDLGAKLPWTALIIAKQRRHLQPCLFQPLHHLRHVQGAKREAEFSSSRAPAAAFDELLLEPGDVVAAILRHAFDQLDRLAMRSPFTAESDA